MNMSKFFLKEDILEAFEQNSNQRSYLQEKSIQDASPNRKYSGRGSMVNIFPWYPQIFVQRTFYCKYSYCMGTMLSRKNGIKMPNIIYEIK